jgi:hypothetical protein
MAAAMAKSPPFIPKHRFSNLVRVRALGKLTKVFDPESLMADCSIVSDYFPSSFNSGFRCKASAQEAEIRPEVGAAFCPSGSARNQLNADDVSLAVVKKGF